MSKKSIGLFTATSIVISSMIGVGVFTSLGYQVEGLSSGFSILLLWVLGGFAALLGAFCYAELGAAMPRSGGEYNFLSTIYHPLLGFLSGWISATVGFSAPIAASAMAFGKYINAVFPTCSAQLTAIIVIVVVAGIHSLHISVSKKFQVITTVLNVLIIITLIVVGLSVKPTGDISFAFSVNDISSSGFAISFFFVSLAYSGWNASAYIAGEIKDVHKNLPRSLLLGTVIVGVLYILINYVFLRCSPVADIKGKAEVGIIASRFILGETGGNVMGLIIALLLLASVSSMIFAGPRVIETIGSDFKLFKLFARRSKNESPIYAILLQGIIAILFVITAKFDEVITYISFTLNLFLLITVLGLIVLRVRQPNLPRPYKTPLYPLIPILFLLISGWLTYQGFLQKPTESLYGLATVFSGVAFYVLNKLLSKSDEASN
ncbi:MAG: amino acid permease [Bacteroidetes bacterium]|nr:amino acid permease [Bacteroidota bacterium]